MGRYVAQRVLAMLPVLLIVAVVTFALIHVTPGDPVSFLVGDQALPEQIEEIKAKLGLDKPLYQQLGIYFRDLLRGDLGESVFSRTKVTELIGQRLEPSLFLAIYSQLFAVLVAIPLGVVAAWKANTWIDRVVMIFAVLGLAIPSFWLGFNLAWLFAVKLDWFPAIGYEPLAGGGRSLVEVPDVAIVDGRYNLRRTHRSHDPLHHAGGAPGGVHTHCTSQGARRVIGAVPPRPKETPLFRSLPSLGLHWPPWQGGWLLRRRCLPFQESAGLSSMQCYDATTPSSRG